MAYRISRNLEASIIQYLESELSKAEWNVKVEKTFSRVYKIDIHQNAIICVRLEDTTHTKVELGSSATLRRALVFIDLFCETDGQRLDLKDFLISKLRDYIPYYEYEISGGEISKKTRNGNLRVIDITDTPINFNIENRKNLDVHDRARHQITLNLSTGRLES